MNINGECGLTTGPISSHSCFCERPDPKTSCAHIFQSGSSTGELDGEYFAGCGLGMDAAHSCSVLSGSQQICIHLTADI